MEVRNGVDNDNIKNRTDMKKTLIAAPLFAAAVLAACNKETVSQTPQTGTSDNEIKLAVSSISVDVKSAYDATTPDADNPLFARVYASSNADFSGIEYGDTEGYMNFTSDALTGFTDAQKTPTPKYYDADADVHLAGFYPAVSAEGSEKWAISSASGTPTATFTFNGDDDVMVTDIITVNKNSATEARDLKFQHLLTQLELKVKAGSSAASTEWGGLYDIQLAKVGGADPDNTVTVTYPAGGSRQAAFSGAATDTGVGFISGEDYTQESPYTLTTTETSVGYILCEPVTDASTSDEDYTIILQTKGRGEQTIPVELKKAGNTESFDGNTAGYKFTVTLTFNVNEIQATATIEPWKPGGNSDITVEG